MPASVILESWIRRVWLERSLEEPVRGVHDTMDTGRDSTSQFSTISSPSSTATLVTSLTISGACVVVRVAVARMGFLLEEVRMML